MHRGDHARRVPETHREGPRSGTPVPTCVRGRAERGGHGLDPARPEGAVRVHHGVRIKDAALVAAATLSKRYIRDRFLPDKAIDLVDEAASRLRMEIDSMPTPLDERMRRIRQLEIEREGIRRDKDAQSQERLEKIERELVQLRKETDALTTQWQAEKDAIKKIRAIKEKMEQARMEADRAGSEGGVGRGAGR